MNGHDAMADTAGTYQRFVKLEARRHSRLNPRPLAKPGLST